MFLRFNPLSAIRDFPRRARQIRRLGPGRLPGDRTRRQFRLEGLEDRCLLSGISAITEFPLPSGSSLPGAVGAITTGPDGNIWFSDPGANSIGTINPSSHAVTLFKIHTAGADPTGITTGPDGNIWFSEHSSSKIGMINPTTDAISEYTLPSGMKGPGNITAGPNGNIWFTDPGTNAIGVATLTTSQLVVTTQPPASVTAGSPFALTVTAENSSGAPITTFDGTVTVALASNPGGATLGGTLTATASNGVATFSGLTLTTAASGYTLVVSSSGIGEGVTSAMSVTPAAASQLVITTEPPASVRVSIAFGLEASIEDQYGNVVTTASNIVSVAFANNPTGATLGGTLSVTASQGVATFSNLTINKTGTGYTLSVSSSGLRSSVSSAISVTKKGGSSVDPGRTTTGNTSPSETSSADTQVTTLAFDSPVLSSSLSLKKRGASLSS